MPLKISEPLSLAVKYLSAWILQGAWLGWTRPFGAHPGFFPAPKGALPPCIRPERADTRPEKTAITSQNHGFRARRAGDFNFSCVFMPQQKRGGRIRPGSRRTCRGKAPPSCLRKTVRSLKVPTGDFIVSLRYTNANFPSMCLEKVRPYFPAFFSRNWLNFFCGTGDSRLSSHHLV